VGYARAATFHGVSGDPQNLVSRSCRRYRQGCRHPRFSIVAFRAICSIAIASLCPSPADRWLTNGARLGKGFGFFMGWSMFLESLFAAIGAALATGGYVAFLLNPDHPDKTTTICAVVCAIVFMAVRLSVSTVVPALVAEFHYYTQVLSGLFCDEKAVERELQGSEST
jgi:hypothetical protein